jgi:hypothetical protein
MFAKDKMFSYSHISSETGYKSSMHYFFLANLSPSLISIFNKIFISCQIIEYNFVTDCQIISNVFKNKVSFEFVT